MHKIWPLGDSSRTARLARISDAHLIARLVDNSWRIHMRILPEMFHVYIERGAAWVVEERGRIQGFLIVAQRNPMVGIVLTAAVSDYADVEHFLDDLLPQVEEEAISRGWNALAQIGYAPWLTDHLQARGFTPMEWIVTYEWAGKRDRIPQRVPLPGLTTRPALASDLPRVVDIDSRVFDTIWQISLEAMKDTMEKAALFDVALVGGEIVGYQWSEFFGGQGHVSRLAVLEEYQGRGIGRSLLADAMVGLCRQGAERITLNTEELNTRSRGLYERAGFVLSGRRVAVLRKDV